MVAVIVIFVAAVTVDVDISNVAVAAFAGTMMLAGGEAAGLLADSETTIP